MKKTIAAFLIGLFLGLAGSVAARPARSTRNFHDAPQGSSLATAVQEFQKRGVLGSSRKGNFDSRSTITRAQLAEILFQYDDSLIKYDDSLIGYLIDLMCAKFQASDFPNGVRTKYTTLCNARRA